MAAVVIGDHELPTVALFDVMQMACIQFQVCVPIIPLYTKIVLLCTQYLATLVLHSAYNIVRLHA